MKNFLGVSLFCLLIPTAALSHGDLVDRWEDDGQITVFDAGTVIDVDGFVGDSTYVVVRYRLDAGFRPGIQYEPQLQGQLFATILDSARKAEGKLRTAVKELKLVSPLCPFRIGNLELANTKSTELEINVYLKSPTTKGEDDSTYFDDSVWLYTSSDWLEDLVTAERQVRDMERFGAGKFLFPDETSPNRVVYDLYLVLRRSCTQRLPK